MRIEWTRRRFLQSGGLSVAGTVVGVNVLAQAGPAADRPPARRSDPLSDALVNEFVWRGHFDLDGVRRMLGAYPSLLNAEYDWGNGDFEMAIGGAGHMGRRDIAEFLMSNGARMDVFVATMLGRIDVVRALLTAFPALLNGRGPHGLGFLHHAKQGGEAAKEVFNYLQALGAN